MRSDRARLQDILEACELLASEIGPRVGSLVTDPLVQAAAQRWVEIIGEAATRLSDEIKEEHDQLPWRAMIGMRNILAHGYFDIDPETLRVVVDRDIPVLRDQIGAILETLPSS